MTALGLGLLGVAAVACVRLWTAFLLERESRRHAWRVQLVELRAVAWKADAVEELRQRVVKLEMRGLRG